VVSFARPFFSLLQFSSAPPLIRTMRLLAVAGVAGAMGAAAADLRQRAVALILRSEAPLRVRIEAPMGP